MSESDRLDLPLLLPPKQQVEWSEAVYEACPQAQVELVRKGSNPLTPSESADYPDIDDSRASRFACCWLGWTTRFSVRSTRLGTIDRGLSTVRLVHSMLPMPAATTHVRASSPPPLT